MRRDRKLSWQQHCPELHLLYLQFSGGSVRCQSNTLQASALLQSGTCTDLDCGLNTQYLILNTVWWLQWNKIILIKKKNLIHMCPQLLVPSLFPALTLVFCRVGMLTHGNVFPSTLQEMHHRSLWCCWRWWWWLEGWFFFFLTGKCKNNYQPLALGPSQCDN